MDIKRVFLIVLDSVGIGEQEDSYLYGDEGSNTLKSCYMQKGFSVPNMKKWDFSTLTAQIMQREKKLRLHLTDA